MLFSSVGWSECKLTELRRRCYNDPNPKHHVQMSEDGDNVNHDSGMDHIVLVVSPSDIK
jgi:hypothetical protein